MSADFSSSNPFRRKEREREREPLSATPPPPRHSSLINHIAYQQAEPQQGQHPGLENININALPAKTKVQKKVRVQSPPPPSPSVPDSASTVGDENYSVFSRHLDPPQTREQDPFEGIISDVSEDEALSRPSRAPANPFSRTLETMERSEQERPAVTSPSMINPGRASMDVDAFKRLLMTGDSGIASLVTPYGTQAHGTYSHAEGKSGTDMSSLSRNSIFEAIQGPQPESPRVSLEVSEHDDGRRKSSIEGTSPSGRRPPPPPSSRHGKMIKVELRDEPSSSGVSTPILQSLPIPDSPYAASIRSISYNTDMNISQTDLNKPLPPPPNRTSHDSERESVFDKESIGKTPEPPSPSSSIRRKIPPEPPLSRRHSQMVSESKLNRSNSGRLSPKVEEDIPFFPSNTNTGAMPDTSRPRSNSGRGPPPPPTRRPASIRTPSQSSTPLTSPSAVSLPPLPPTRGSSIRRPPSVHSIDPNTPLTSPSAVSLPPPPPTRGSSIRRPPSVHSIDIPSISTSNKRASFMTPPPPPPHRHGRPSMETQGQPSPNASRRTSGEYGRRSMDSARRGSAASSMLASSHVAEEDEVEAGEGAGRAAGNGQQQHEVEVGEQTQRHDILADLTKLQRDIDALRIQSGKGG